MSTKSRLLRVWLYNIYQIAIVAMMHVQEIETSCLGLVVASGPRLPNDKSGSPLQERMSLKMSSVQLKVCACVCALLCVQCSCI